jgi:hypothetical protein
MTSPIPDAAADSSLVGVPDPADALAAQYDRLRDDLKRALAAPVKDMAEVQRLIDRLDEVHMGFKAAHGLRGNNPNE